VTSIAADDDSDAAATTAASAASAQRLDKWLWFARVVKSRTMAAALVASVKVRVNRNKVDKPAHALKRDDVVTVSVGRKVRVLRVMAAGTRRGPAAEAQSLFEDLTPPPAPAHGATHAPGRATPEPAAPASRTAGSGRPTKRERRQIDALRDRR
jgi:ribosome-associated heat shock protein Hsp15